MMGALIAMIDRGGLSVTLEVDEENAPARALYEGLGFEVVSATDYFHEEGESAAPTPST
jgi:ribosomal protein S18 acetylase RimI-like enzyme